MIYLMALLTFLVFFGFSQVLRMLRTIQEELETQTEIMVMRRETRKDILDKLVEEDRRKI